MSEQKRAESPMFSIAQGNALGIRYLRINAPCKGNCKNSTALSEERLPEEGYFLETSGKESIVVNIPVKDRGLFTKLVRKFGWACM